MSAVTSKNLINLRLFTVLVLGFASGLPLALTGSTLQAWFTDAHIDLITIGTLSFLGIPYTLKFLWAPVLDHYSFPMLGKRKGWILLMQLGLIISILLLANMNPASQASRMGLIALMIALFSASQDISITAYQTDILSPDERGLGASYYIFAYRVAALISGGLALISAQFFGWKLTYELIAILLFFPMIMTYQAPKPIELVTVSNKLYKTFSVAVTDLFQRKKITLIFLFIILYKIGDAFALQLMMNFLLHGLNFSLSEVGIAYKTVSFIAVVAGAFIGGIALTQWNIYRALLIFGIAQAFSNLMFVILALSSKNFALMASSIFIENFCSGLSTAALLAFMMSLCDHRFSATQFAIFSTAASLGRVFLGPVAAVLVQNAGWVQYFLWSFFLSLPGIVLLLFLKERVLEYVPAIAD